MILAAIPLAVTLLAPPFHVERCQATVFGYRGDKLAGGKALLLKRRVRPSDIGIAHRTLPLGTTVLVINPRTSGAVVARVIDRGPYGALLGGKWINYAPRYRSRHRVRKRPRYRGCVDLTPRAAELIGHNWREPVVLIGRM